MKKMLLLAALLAATSGSSFSLVPETDEAPIIEQVEEPAPEEAPAE